MTDSVDLPVSVSPKVGDYFTMEITERRRWWRFWQKPRRLVRTFRIVATVP